MTARQPSVKLTPDGDIVFPSVWITDRSEAIVQKALIRLRTHRGEFVLDRFVGIDWIALRDGKITPQRLQTIRSVIAAEIDSMEGVSVLSSAASMEGRTVSVSFRALINDDDDEPVEVTAVFGVGGTVDAYRAAGMIDPLSLRSLIRGGPRAA